MAMSSTSKWILGVMGPVITAVLIYWLTPPRPSPDTTPPSSQPAATVPEATSYSWDGRVIDGAKKSVLSNTAVTLEIAGQKSTDATDDEGRFIFLIPKTTQPFIAHLTVGAQGYNEFTRQLTLDSRTNQLEALREIALTPVPPSPTTPVPPQTFPKPVIHANVAALAYRPKSQDQAVKVQLPPSMLMRVR
jgi:hypothetical protein